MLLCPIWSMLINLINQVFNFFIYFIVTHYFEYFFLSIKFDIGCLCIFSVYVLLSSTNENKIVAVLYVFIKSPFIFTQY